MPRPSPYTDKQKAAILEGVKSGRKSGKKWTEILAAATEAGYKGGLQYLMKFAHKAGAVRRRRKSSVATARTATKRKPGRPKGGVSSNGAGLGDIDRIVERMVEQRVGTAVAKAVQALEEAARELQRL